MILDELAAYAKVRVDEAKQRVPIEEMRERAEALPKGRGAFETALRHEDLSFICEVKKASPSKGIIEPDFHPVEVARAYEVAGADCISCLTEPRWFQGSDAIFAAVREAVGTPMLRKDFTVDAYQIYEARCLGADAVLLICALLDGDTIAEYLRICDGLGLSALVEAHDATEVVTAVEAGARIIGVNNRDLRDFSVDTGRAASLRDEVPADVLFVAESGIREASDVAALAAEGVDAVLVGEALMRADDKGALLKAFREAAACGRRSERYPTADGAGDGLAATTEGALAGGADGSGANR